MSSITKETLKTVQEHSFKNKKEEFNSVKCAFFHCFQIFNSNEVDTFLTEDDGKEIALCPHFISDTPIAKRAFRFNPK